MRQDWFDLITTLAPFLGIGLALLLVRVWNRGVEQQQRTESQRQAERALERAEYEAQRRNEAMDRELAMWREDERLRSEQVQRDLEHDLARLSRVREAGRKHDWR